MKNLLVLLALLVGTANAEVPNPLFVPEAGFWWNPDESGRGYAIEVQDRGLFIAAYVYEDVGAGDPVWFTAGGATNRDFDFSAELKVSEGGQCFGCVYTAPSSSDAGLGAQIVFTSAVTANLFVDGETIPIQRFWYSDSITDLLLSLLGQWQIIVDYSDADDDLFPFEADLLVFDRLITVDGDEQADGFQGETGREAAGSYNDQDDVYIMVVGTSDLDVFQAYYFFVEDLGTDRFRGFAEKFVRGNDLDGNGFIANGFRTAGRKFVQETSFTFGKGTTSKAAQPVIQRTRADTKLVVESEKRLAGINATVRTLVAQIDAKRKAAKN